jgi:outer membrane protein
LIVRIWLALLLAAGVSAAAAEDLPLWEAGVGVGVTRLPDYRGSDEHRTYVLPIPYFVYRGDNLRVDRRGLRGELFESERMSLHISANLGPPSRSERNETRSGMADLDPTVEIGPSLNARLYQNASRDRLFSLRLPVRAVIATDLSHTEYIGWVFLPHLAFDFLQKEMQAGWNFGVTAGPIFASNRYHDYYYKVIPEVARAGRSVYDPDGGYSGASIGMTLSKRFPGYWVGAFLRYDGLRNAEFEDSPLVRTKHATMFGIAVSKVISRSKESVKRDPDKEP